MLNFSIQFYNKKCNLYTCIVSLIANIVSDKILFQNLAENNLGSNGAKLVAYMMTINSRLTKLDISGK